MAKEKQPNPVDIYVGSRIRLQRQLLKMSQETLGEAVGITFQQIQKYEKGTNRVGASRLQQIGNAMGVPASYFFDGAPNSNTKNNGSNSIVKSAAEQLMNVDLR